MLHIILYYSKFEIIYGSTYCTNTDVCEATEKKSNLNAIVNATYFNDSVRLKYIGLIIIKSIYFVWKIMKKQPFYPGHTK